MLVAFYSAFERILSFFVFLIKNMGLDRRSFSGHGPVSCTTALLPKIPIDVADVAAVGWLQTASAQVRISLLDSLKMYP